MHVFLAYLCGLGCSLCYGVSTVLQQDGVKRQDNIESLHLAHAYKLFQQAPYRIGIILDIFGWLFFLYASRELPLFLSLSFVSFSLVVTAVIANIFRGVKISQTEKLSLGLIFIGLVILGVIAEPSEIQLHNQTFKLCL